MSPVPVTLKRSLNDLQHNLFSMPAGFARLSRSNCFASIGYIYFMAEADLDNAYEKGLSLPPVNLGFSFDIHLTCIICIMYMSLIAR